MRAIGTLVVFLMAGLAAAAVRAADPETAHESGYTSAGFPFLGREDAPITLVEFSDFHCPFCRRFFASTFPQIKREYIDTGKVRYLFIDFPLEQMHPHARQAAEAAHCAGDQGKFWPMHESLFRNPGAPEVAQLYAQARVLELEQQVFETCIRSRKHAARIDRGLSVGAAAGVTGTPTFLIAKSGRSGMLSWNVSIVGAQPIEQFRTAIEDVLAAP